MAGTVHELVHEFEALGLLVSTIDGPVSDALRQVQSMFGDAARSYLGGGDRSAVDVSEIDVPALQASLRAFYAMPQEDVRRVLRGWSPVPDRPSLAELFDSMGHQRVARVLSILATPANGPAAAKAGAAAALVFAHDFRPAGGLPSVRIEVMEGATRAEVIASLQAAVNLVLDGWESIIDAARIGEVGTRTIDNAPDLGSPQVRAKMMQ